jgi:hypothetical protein
MMVLFGIFLVAVLIIVVVVILVVVKGRKYSSRNSKGR